MHTDKNSVMNIPVRVRRAESLSPETDKMEQRVRQRAYELFQARGGRDGAHLDDWVDAERELIWKPCIEIREKGGQLSIDVELPGIQPRDLDVKVTADRLLVRARTSHLQLEYRGAIHISERTTKDVFRAVDLPKPIDPERVRAEYYQGLLHVVASLSEAHVAAA